MQQDAPGTDAAEANAISAYLRAHPAFLAENPALYDHLAPPERVHGATLADHMAALLAATRRRAHAAERAGAEAAAARRAAEAFVRRVQDTVIALMRAPDPAWLATHELAALLHVDAARICFETAAPEGAATLPAGTITATLGQRQALVRTAAPDALLHGEAVALATEEALIRVPRRTGPALLALACRDPGSLAGAGTDALAFLGQAVGAALDTSLPTTPK